MILKEGMLNFINVSAISVFLEKVAAIPSGSHVWHDLFTEIP